MLSIQGAGTEEAFPVLWKPTCSFSPDLYVIDTLCFVIFLTSLWGWCNGREQLIALTLSFCSNYLIRLDRQRWIEKGSPEVWEYRVLSCLAWIWKAWETDPVTIREGKRFVGVDSQWAKARRLRKSREEGQWVVAAFPLRVIGNRL